ncbi:alpha-L-fucosidase, partial [Grimontia sedimenti]|uniref:alpha-L-fucosidase n=1 Tax=Grimontia sedimenti TaxID=2711294 RepID=UPI00197ACAD0
EVFKQQYFDLNKSFNPIRFQPDEWAELAQEGGFKYFLFTTKHHDWLFVCGIQKRQIIK